MVNNNIIFRQMFDSESSTFTYILADPLSQEGVVIDPVLEKVERDLKIINELNIKLKYILETHVHADHITGAYELKQKTGAQIALGASAQVSCADINLLDGEELSFGAFKIKALFTPGHTEGCTTYIVNNMAFTGDTLLIRGNGRTDFQGGSAETLYKSITEKLFTLPDETLIYPAHNYVGLHQTSVGEEKAHNPRIGNGKSCSEFVDIMNNLKLAHPKKIAESLPANKNCGRISDK